MSEQTKDILTFLAAVLVGVLTLIGVYAFAERTLGEPVSVTAPPAAPLTASEGGELQPAFDGSANYLQPALRYDGRQTIVNLQAR